MRLKIASCFDHNIRIPKLTLSCWIAAECMKQFHDRLISLDIGILSQNKINDPLLKIFPVFPLVVMGNNLDFLLQPVFF